jgi:hypothetical protein
VDGHADRRATSIFDRVIDQIGDAPAQRERPGQYRGSPFTGVGHRAAGLADPFDRGIGEYPQLPPRIGGLAASFSRALALIIAASFSAIMIVGALVFVELTAGITEASTTRSASSPLTRSWSSTTAIAQGGAVHFVGIGPSVEEATEDAARRAVEFAVARTGLGREEAYMLLSIIGELQVGTSPRPVMATRLIVPEEPLRAAGRGGELP